MKPLRQKPASRVVLYLLLLLASLGLMFGLKRMRQWNTADATAAGDTLRVAIQYAPGSFFISGDTLDGIDYQALRQLNIPFRLYPITSPAEGLNGLRNHRYDLVIADMPRTADSADHYIFTDPIYLDHQVLIQRRDSATTPITSPLQLGGKTIVVPQGSPIVSRLQNLSREIGDTINIIQRPATAERLMTELALGADSVPLTVANSLAAQQIAQEFPNLDHSLSVSLNQLQPWILRPDSHALRDTINNRLHKKN